MSILNPIQLMGLLKQNNPKAVCEQIIRQNYSNNPMMIQLLQMGQNNDIQGLEQFARQYLAQQGHDFDRDMTELRQLTKGN